MAKQRRQTRRSISVKGITYQRIRDFLNMEDPPGSISGYIEGIVKADLDKRGVAVPQFLRERPRKKKKDFEDDPPHGNHFTF